MPINPYNPSAPGTPAAGDRKKTGSGFTNLNRIMQASKGNRLGEAVGGGVAQQATQARTGLEQARTGFETDAEKNRLDSDENKKAADTGIQRAVQLGETDDDTVKKFETFRAGRYDGPQQLANEDKVVTQAQQAQNLGDLSTSNGGRQALLQRFVGDSGYSQGKQRLDNLLLGQSGSQELRDARRQTQNLTNEAYTTADAAREKAQYLANSAQAFGNNVVGRLDGGINDNIASVDADVDYVKKNEDLRAALYKQIQDKLAAGGTRGAAGSLGDAKNVNLDNVNQALALAQANNIAQAGDTDMVKKLYSNLMTPAEMLYRQQTQTDGNGMLGYGDKAKATSTTTSGGNVYSNLGIDEVLKNAFVTKGYENLDRNGVASDLQRAKAAALAKLAAKQSVFTDADKKFKASSAAFDMNKAGSDVDAEIARLKGESIKDLPARYEQAALEQKLARTFAPSAPELVDDISANVKGLTAANSSLGDRAASAARLYYTPLRAMNGVALDTAKIGKDQLEKQANDIFSGNVGNVLTNNITAANPALKIAGSALEKIPVAGSLLAKPVALASSATAKAAEAAKSVISGAGNVASSVGNAIASVFCYGAGTPIKMKNGSFKAVEKLQLGDEVFYGGKVTATGKAMEDDIYDYLGCKVTGAHAVFENGKFVRVEDSQFAKKVDGSKEIEVFPIETENHILVTKTHLGSDFSEIDEGHNVTPEKRLEKLNSNTVRLKKLDTASAIIFKKNNEDT